MLISAYFIQLTFNNGQSGVPGSLLRRGIYAAESANQDLLAQRGGDAFFRRQNALEIQRIRRRDGDRLARPLSPKMAEHFHSAGKRELLA
jgi:hypothetical protein